MDKNFICNSNYVCQGVLNLLISYLDDQSRKKLKCTCKYMFRKIKLKTLKGANHLSAKLFPELDFLELPANKINLKLPLSKALKIKNKDFLNLYNYDPKDIEKLYIEEVTENYPNFVYLGYLKELYVKRATKMYNYFAQNKKIINLEIICVDHVIDFTCYPDLKLCKCPEFIARRIIIDYFVITSNISLKYCATNNVVLLYRTDYSSIQLTNSTIHNLYLCEYDLKTLIIDIDLDGNILIENIYFMGCDEDAKQIFIDKLKPLNYKDIKKSDLPYFENCFGVDMYE